MTFHVTGTTTGLQQRDNDDYIDSTGITVVESKPSITNFLKEETTASVSGLEYQPSVATERLPVDKTSRQSYQEEQYHLLGFTTKRLLNNLFDRIAAANDHELGSSEKSNNFDEWKDMLHSLSRIGENLNNHHRKILGSLIVCTREQDISDFDIQQLRLFLNASNSLRQPSLSKLDSKQIIKGLLNIGLRPAIHLGSDDASDEELREVQQMMTTLIEKSRLRHEG